MSLGMFPHASDTVIHAPGTCTACDQRPDLQALREHWSVPYTVVPAGRRLLDVESPNLCASDEQPPPEPAPAENLPNVQMLVLRDLLERAEVGRSRYGTYLHPANGRDALVDAYQECLDMALYLRQLLVERGAD